MSKQTISIEVDIPEGYRFLRKGSPKRGERYMDMKGIIFLASQDWDDHIELIIEKLAPNECK